MLKLYKDIEIEEFEIFGLVGLIDSGRTTLLGKVYNSNKGKVNYVSKLPILSFLKIKTVLGNNRNHEYVKRLNLNPNKRIYELNYSETRKLLFLLSIFTSKPIIILDEPLLLLESSTKKVMFEIIKDIKKTFLISFDNLAEAKTICNRYAIIKEYEIIEVNENNKETEIFEVLANGENIDKAKLPLKNMKIDYFSHDEIEFIYKGNINELLKYLVEIKLKFLEIKSADLENLYKYYLKK